MAMLYLLLILAAVASAQITDQCLDCICKMEGCEGQVGKCRDDGGSLSCGPYQIKKPYWREAGRKGGDYQKCTKQFACSETTVRKYMDRYGPRCRSRPTCEHYMRLHNGGPSACKAGSKMYKAATGYWNSAKTLCGL